MQDACKECKERREQFEARKVSGEIERVGGREDIGERGIENHSGRGERKGGRKIERERGSVLSTHTRMCGNRKWFIFNALYPKTS